MTEQGEKLQAFKTFLEKSVEEMLDIMADGGDYEDRFDLNISFNGKNISLPLHADLYERFIGILDGEIEEEN